MSCNFMPCNLVRHFHVLLFHVRHFQRPRSNVCFAAHRRQCDWPHDAWFNNRYPDRVDSARIHPICCINIIISHSDHCTLLLDPCNRVCNAAGFPFYWNCALLHRRVERAVKRNELRTLSDYCAVEQFTNCSYKLPTTGIIRAFALSLSSHQRVEITAPLTLHL